MGLAVSVALVSDEAGWQAISREIKERQQSADFMMTVLITEDSNLSDGNCQMQHKTVIGPDNSFRQLL